jgi:hypothetical protein
LALMAQAKEGTSRIWVQRGKEWRLEEWNNERLNEVYLDVGLTGKSHQVRLPSQLSLMKRCLD